MSDWFVRRKWILGGLTLLCLLSSVGCTAERTTHQVSNDEDAHRVPSGDAMITSSAYGDRVQERVGKYCDLSTIVVWHDTVDGITYALCERL